MDAEIEEGDFEENDFKNLKFVRPYKQLMIWAVLLNRCETIMVKLYGHMSHSLRKWGFCLQEKNKHADHLFSNCKADQHLCFRYTDTTISLFPISEISSF